MLHGACSNPDVYRRASPRWLDFGGFWARSHASIHGTRAVLSTVKDKQDKLSLWTRILIERRGYKRAAVALAAKNARILWAMMVKGETYQLKSV